MNKYGKIYIGYEPGTEDVDTESNYEVVEVEAKNYPEDFDNWDTICADEVLNTIVDAGKKLMKEIGFHGVVTNNLYNIYWDKNKPSNYYDGKLLLVVYYNLDKKEFITGVDRWSARDNGFVSFGNKVVYWAEFPAPPIQT